MYDFLDLKLIRYMNEEPSLSAVAARARMSLPAISQRLSKLEEEVNAKLVFRSGGFGLTPAGKIFLKSANVISNELENLDRQLRAEGEHRETHLRILATESQLIDDLPQILERLVRAMPSLHLSVQQATVMDITTRLLNGQADIGLVSPGTAAHGLQLIPYKADRACIIAPLTHPLAQKVGPIQLKDALAYEFIGSEDDHGLASLIDAMARQLQETVHYRLKVTSAEAQAILVGQTNLGIALTLESVGRRHARNQPISVIRLAEDWAPRHSQIYVQDIANLSSSGQMLVSMLRSQLAPAAQEKG